MPTVIDSLIFELGLKSTKFETDAQKAGETVSKTRKSVEADAKKLEASFLGVADSVNQLHRTLLGLFAAFTGGKTIKALVGDLTDAGAATGRLATNLGMSADKVDAFGRAVEQMGGSSGEAKESLQKLSDQYQTFLQTGNLGDLPRIIGQLNTFGKTAVDVTKPLTGQLDAISDGLANIAKTDPAKASFIARQIFGNTGMANLALQGSKKMREMLRDAQEAALTPKQAEIMQKLQQQVVRLQNAFTSVGNAIVEAFGPSLTDALQKAADWIKKHIGWMKDLALGIGAVALSFSVLKGAFLAASWLFNATPLGRTVFLLSLLAAGIAHIADEWRKTGKVGGMTMEEWGKQFKETAELLKKHWKEIFIDGLKDMFNDLMAWMKSKINEIWQKAFGRSLFADTFSDVRERLIHPNGPGYHQDSRGGAAGAIKREFGGAAEASPYPGNPSEAGGSTNDPVNPPHRRTEGEPDDATKRKIDKQLEKIFPPKGGSTGEPSGGSSGGSSRVGGRNFRLTDQQRAEMASSIRETAEDLGINPEHLAAIMSFETGGTMDPWKAGPTTKWGQHRGLIQWGEPQARQYGVYKGMPIRDQVRAVGRYMKDNGVRPGMGLAQVYGSVLAGGTDDKYLDRMDKNGTTPRSGAERMWRTAHRNTLAALESSRNASKMAGFSQMGGAALSSNISDMRQIHSYNSNATAHVNQVNIHVPSGDPQTIGTGLGNALQRQLAAGQANYGAR